LIFRGTGTLIAQDSGRAIQKGIFNALAMFGQRVFRKLINGKKAAVARLLGGSKRTSRDVTEESQHHFLFLGLGIDAYQAVNRNL
jgi:hypothetical protein